MATKTLWIDPDLPRELADAVRRAEPMLERELGDAAGRVEVSWSAVEPEPRVGPAARLTLVDSGVTRSEVFFQRDFNDDLYLRRMLRAVWVEVLNERLRIQRRRVHESLAEAGEA